MNENIDFVVPWVDGNDDKWIEERKKNKEGFDGGDDNECRFRDWGLLKYWFRSIERNAPWMRKVHFITYGHLPSFLNPNCPKLHIVKHKDYIPHQYLPTFSANPIELNMHRIEDLSECFVYFNDDMFLNSQMNPSEFFINDKPCYEALEALIQTDDIDEIYFHILLNNISVINKNYYKYTVLKNNFTKWINLKYGKDVLRNICLLPWKKYQNIVNRHLPVPLLKSTMQEVWEIEYVNLDRTSSNKFRAITDVNQYLFRYWDIMRGNFVPRKCRGKAYHIGMEETGDVINDILNGKNNMICINDTPNIKDFERIRDEIANAFLTRYPDKCQYEL